MSAKPFIIDAFDRLPPYAYIGTAWEMYADSVMGGVSTGRMSHELVDGRPCVRLAGEVSLDNNGGFIQLAIDLQPDRTPFDGSRWSGIEIDTYGNGEIYNVHLRTSDVQRPWQSYRQSFAAPPQWQTLQLPFKDFEPHRIDTPLDVRQLRRIGIVAIGRAFAADVAIGGLRLY